MPEIPYTLSAASRVAIDVLVEVYIAREHGRDETAMLFSAAEALALAAVEFDGRPAFLEHSGWDALHHVAFSWVERGLSAWVERDLSHWVHAEVGRLVDAGLAARLCQCRELDAGLAREHEHPLLCEGHYERDSPAVQGLRLCGACRVVGRGA